MAGRHVVLVVEDDPRMTEEIVAALTAIGLDHLHARTQEEALAFSKKGAFCCAMVDLKISPCADSPRPDPAAGLVVVQELRRERPGRNAADHHVLQIIVMSGHVTDAQSVDACRDHGDRFVAKPFNSFTIKKLVEEALERSGRGSHEKCGLLDRQARKRGAAAASSTNARPCLTISGKQVKQRTEVAVDGRPALLMANSLMILVNLIAARLGEQAGGLVDREDLGYKPGQGWNGVARLRQDLARAFPGDTDMKRIIASSGPRSYCLDTDEIEIGAVDWKALTNHSSEDVAKVAREMVSLQDRKSRLAAGRLERA